MDARHRLAPGVLALQHQRPVRRGSPATVARHGRGGCVRRRARGTCARSAPRRCLPATTAWSAVRSSRSRASGAMAGALARNSCEDSVPRCEGSAFATAGDWVHGIGGLAEILGIAGAALVLAATLPRRWAIYSASTGCAAFAGRLRLGSPSLPVGRHRRASPRTHTRGMGSRVGHPDHIGCGAANRGLRTDPVAASWSRSAVARGRLRVVGRQRNAMSPWCSDIRRGRRRARRAPTRCAVSN